jgi:hypothetical protein
LSQSEVVDMDLLLFIVEFVVRFTGYITGLAAIQLEGIASFKEPEMMDTNISRKFKKKKRQRT